MSKLRPGSHIDKKSVANGCSKSGLNTTQYDRDGFHPRNSAWPCSESEYINVALMPTCGSEMK